MAEQKKTNKDEFKKNDEELDLARAIDIAREFIKKYVGVNLYLLQFKVEHVEKNGTQTRYNVIVSVVPDIGEERDYYLIKVDIPSGKPIEPFYKGKLGKDGKVVLNNISESVKKLFD